MSPRMQATLIQGGRRLHLQDGPIDLIVMAEGPGEATRMAYRAAAQRLSGILDELCRELGLLRSHALPEVSPEGTVARSMWRAVLPFAADRFMTPMAAVAGAVAEAVLAAMVEAAELERAAVNNGGDIALHLAPGASLAIGLIDRDDRPSLLGKARIQADTAVRGIATSGWRGRSFSLGIADVVTVLARTAPEADAAATAIANAVDLPRHPAVTRRPAVALRPDNDLGERLVTTAVGALSPADRTRALEAGVIEAERLRRRGLIVAAALHLQGETRTVANEWAQTPPNPIDKPLAKMGSDPMADLWSHHA